ncbi:MAG TPA: flagellar motor protein MotB [Polyangiaceae bacterium]|nr:flagellar motor protein MotB [Polyangiaceae bacterium]
MAGAPAPSGGGGRVIIIKKKGKGHAAHHGGAWKVAYADFVTAMMAFFMVMWLLAQTDQSTRQQLSEYFRTGVFSGAPSVLNGGSGIQNKAYFDVVGQSSIQPEQAHFERVAAAVRAAMQRQMAEDARLQALAKQLKVSVTEEGLLIQILDGSGDDLLFDRSSADLKPRLTELLATIAPILGRLDNKIQIHGHTDAKPFPTGSNRSNWALSFERADSARLVLEKSGLKKGQVGGVFAHGSSALYNTKEPFAPENRRLAILAVRRGMETYAAQGVSATPKPTPTGAGTKPAPPPVAPAKHSEDEGAQN